MGPTGAGDRENTSDVDDVLAVNDAFYRAFETGDMEAMAGLWERSSRAVCVHPGSPAITGWADVERSWALLLAAPARPQFIVTEAIASVVGDAAWVTLTENIIVGGGSGAGTAVNVFARTDGVWRMVVHHGAPISRGRIL